MGEGSLAPEMFELLGLSAKEIKNLTLLGVKGYFF